MVVRELPTLKTIRLISIVPDSSRFSPSRLGNWNSACPQITLPRPAAEPARSVARNARMNTSCTAEELKSTTSTPVHAAIPAPECPTVKEVRSHLDESCRQRSTLKGLMLFAVPGIVYLAAFVGFILLPQWPAKIACAVVVCIAIPSLFVIATTPATVPSRRTAG
jgi:hypothetical protein